jgi:oxygen-independent coproporphyrinogen-3 oxidase
VLTPAQRYNEYVMTRLRTIWGCRLAEMAEIGPEYPAYFEREVRRFEIAGQVEMWEGCYRLTRAGKLMADHIASSLFWVE